MERFRQVSFKLRWVYVKWSNGRENYSKSRWVAGMNTKEWSPWASLSSSKYHVSSYFLVSSVDETKSYLFLLASFWGFWHSSVGPTNVITACIAPVHCGVGAPVLRYVRTVPHETMFALNSLINIRVPCRIPTIKKAAKGLGYRWNLGDDNIQNPMYVSMYETFTARYSGLLDDCNCVPAFGGVIWHSKDYENKALDIA